MKRDFPIRQMAVLGAVCVALPITLPRAVQAQETLGSIGVGSSIAAGMDATAGLNASRTMQRARGIGAGGMGAGGMGGGAGTPGAEGEVGAGRPGGPGMPTGAGEGGGGGAAATAATGKAQAPATPIPWGRQTGEEILSQLLAGRGRGTVSSRVRRSTRGRRRRTSRRRTSRRRRSVASRYQIPARGWLAHYLPEDRYKLVGGDWSFVTTPNDPFYYLPNAPAMMRKPAGEVIGFHTWQDAMIAGYRPDPYTEPAPAAQIVHLASLSRGSMLARYVEYVYDGEVSPRVFDLNYDYAVNVAQIVGSHSYTRSLVGTTVDQVIGASIGQGSVPASVGGSGAAGVSPISVSELPAATGPAGGAAMNAPGGAPDKRETEFNNFSGRAARLSATNGGNNR